MQAYLVATLGSSAVRITSLWLDKFVWVYPKQSVYPGRRELADLAVTIRVNKSATWMWLLQGKKMANALDPLPTDDSTTKEVELLTKNLPFELKGFVRSANAKGWVAVMVPISLGTDFGVPPAPATFNHWFFLSFFGDPIAYNANNAENPCQWMELELPRCRGVVLAWISSRLRLLGRSLVHGRRGACDAGAGGGQGGFVGTLEVQR